MLSEDEIPFNPFQPGKISVEDSQKIGSWGGPGLHLATSQEQARGTEKTDMRGDVYWGDRGDELILKCDRSGEGVSSLVRIRVENLSDFQDSDICLTFGLGTFLAFNRNGQKGTKISVWRLEKLNRKGDVFDSNLVEVDNVELDLNIDMVFKDEQCCGNNLFRGFIYDQETRSLHRIVFERLGAYQT